MRIVGVSLDDAIPDVRAVFVGPPAEAALFGRAEEMHNGLSAYKRWLHA